MPVPDPARYAALILSQVSAEVKKSVGEVEFGDRVADHIRQSERAADPTLDVALRKVRSSRRRGCLMLSLGRLRGSTRT